jgi:hypothetical protein
METEILSARCADRAMSPIQGTGDGLLWPLGLRTLWWEEIHSLGGELSTGSEAHFVQEPGPFTRKGHLLSQGSAGHGCGAQACR